MSILSSVEMKVIQNHIVRAAKCSKFKLPVCVLRCFFPPDVDSTILCEIREFLYIPYRITLVKSAPLRAFTGSFQQFTEMLQTYIAITQYMVVLHRQGGFCRHIFSEK